MAAKFKKQSSEIFMIAANFSLNMDLTGGEDLVLANCTVTAADVDGNDASSTVLDQATKAIGSDADGEVGYLKIMVKAGEEVSSPYKITFKSGLTTKNESWEKDVFMTIKEQ